ncbi:Arylsulfotransferase-domain-containing protein [Xylariomycetidae sp. FL0641]|nr:Arylsulfotransferase-domain-containing protein [Xylariomycetidae sp. FL0641]
MPTFARSLLLSLACACRLLPVHADLPPLPPSEADAFNAGAYGDRPNQTYHSSNIMSPLFLVNSWDKNASTVGSHIFFSPFFPNQKASCMIYDATDLSLVFATETYSPGGDCRVQIYEGNPYLTFWTGFDFKGHGTGGGIMLDQNYKEYKNITTKGLPTGADSHDFTFTHDGGVILNNYHTLHTDLTKVGGPPEGRLLDCAFQEVDIATGDVRFTWIATDHFDLTESWSDGYQDQPNGGWDWFHQNAISKTPDGNYLISSRHLRMVALLSGKDGSRIWQVGGKNNSFTDLSDGRATNFGFQHDARFTDETMTEITLFDNHDLHVGASPTPGCTEDCTRALRVRIDTDAMTVQVVSEWYHPASVQAWAQGGYNLQPDGNAMIGWGVVPAFTEFKPNGDIIMDIQTRPWFTTVDGGSPEYRVYKLDWEGHPTWNPSIASVDGVVYVSWNGATNVKSWVLYGGDSHISLARITTAEKTGFETAITPSTPKSFVRVEALDASGAVLGTSDVLDTSSGDSVGSIIRT